MADLSELMLKEKRTAYESEQLKQRIHVLEAMLSNMNKLLKKTTTGIDADTVDGYHASGLPNGLLVLPPVTVVDYAYELTHVSEDHTFDADSTTLDELADIVGTIINDLIALNIFCVPK
jgi:hypothetical protein